MIKKLLFPVCCLAATVSFAQKINYEISFPNIVHHEAVVELTVTDFSQKEMVFRMSRSSPGRYATHEFGKNIYNVTAIDKSGKELPVQRLDGDVYGVSGANGFVKMCYTLYANYADGTYAGVDQTNVHFNMPATLLWTKGLEQLPVTIRFDVPKDKKWRVATQLKPTADPLVYTAPNLQYLMDSPTKIGELVMKEWTLPNADGRPSQFRLALEIPGRDSLASGFAEKVKKVTTEAQQVFGEFPAFDVDQYTFIASINPFVKGDGMEHRNSTMIALPVEFTGANDLLGVFSHEFFHTWNVERIRPKTLEPFNFEKSNMSFELWFAEGFTQYYGELLLKRADFQSLDEYCQTLTGLVNTKENTAGAKRISPVQASCQAVFVDAGVSVDRNNYINTYTSYYPYGGSIALALDLELRARNLSLDGFMKAVWLKYGKPEVPYQVTDLQAVLETYAGNKGFAQDFFKKYVNGHASFNYQPMLEKAGLSLKKQAEGKAWIGDVRYGDGETLTIQSNTVTDTPLYKAGLDIDDQILKIDGRIVGKQAALHEILQAHKPGDQLLIEYKHHGQSQSTMITLAENPRLVVQTYEQLNLPVTDAMRTFRKNWLDTQVRN